MKRTQLETPYGIKYGRNCLLIGEFEKEDWSFDHEFGVENRNGYKLVFFVVNAFINGRWEEVEMKDEDTLERMKDFFLKYAEERLEAPCVA